MLLFVAAALARSDVAILVSDTLDAYEAPVEAFRRAVNRPVTVYDLQGDRDRATVIARQLAADPPALVFAVGAKAAWVAQHDLERVPVVYAMILDPARYGISGTRITGVSMEVPAEAALAQFQLFAPEVKTIGVLLSVDNQSQSSKDALAAARTLGIDTKVQRVTTRRDLRAAWQRMAADVDALWLLPDPVAMSPEAFRWLRAEALRRKLPILASTENLVRAGALLCVAPDNEAVGRQAAELALRVLDAGETPGMIDPVPPDALRVVLNRDTLDQIGLPVEEIMLDFADEVVQEGAGR